MSKTLRTIGVIAGAVALVATGVGAVAGVGLAVAGTTVGSIATYASLAAAVASIGAQVTAKKPAAKGAITQLLIGSNLPQPYLMGFCYSAGIQVHDVGYGGTVNKVSNPWRFIATVHSCCGPIDGLVQQLADFTPIGAYYSGWLTVDAQLGARPELDQIKPQFAGAGASPPGWGPDYKLSGHAAIGWGLKFDKDAKRFSGGVPALGAIWRGVSAYDPRADSTFPGGSGPQRIDDEATWPYTRNAALHAGTYAFGRHVNGRRVFGADLGEDGVDFTAVAAWANVCDANGWTVNGSIFEPGDKWNNLKRIAECGGGEPLFMGGLLSFCWDAPGVALDTIDLDDLADGELSAPAMRPWKDRLNTIVPKFRSPAHRWDFIAVAAVASTAGLAADGEEKADERQFDLVTDGDQATELAGYIVENAREAGPFVLPCKTRMIEYRAGDKLDLSEAVAAELAVAQRRCVLVQRGVDPATGIVTLTLRTDDPAKHARALGRTTIIPPVHLAPTAADLDISFTANSAGADVAALALAVGSLPTDGTTLIELLETTQALVDEQAALITDQQAALDSQQTLIGEQQTAIGELNDRVAVLEN
ncbi:hypothetical protein [Sphingomonas sp.]|uniref:hypothetical protein n=1 Tax=Sphingomonas sp. TaxID=28214 RepID=UPI002D7EAEF0|nr:hypothetical protein [Sphingomonas sp.]HEU0045072.1 hypothetical protein [Sphingomonas sp.]